MHNTLFLQRLRIMTRNGGVAYDEKFHRGVNIIRGQNSSGKSTIVRFIFFVLGGYYTDFVPEAMKCRSVMAEVCINGNVITIARFLEKRDESKVNGSAPMYIHFGPMTEVLEPLNFELSTDSKLYTLNSQLWNKYPYLTTDKQRSFSNVLFEMLGLPEVKADSNITMHQILRLIYLDQESPISSLFFYEQFDKEIYRETVANLLLGLYDKQYSQAKQDLQITGKALSEVKVSIKNVGEFLQDPRTKSSAFIRGQIDRLNDEIEELTKQVRELRGIEFSNSLVLDKQNTSLTDSKPSTLNSKLKLEHRRLQEEISNLRKQSDDLEREVKQIENEIEDSNYFIDALTRRVDALNHSIVTRDYFDSMHLEFCPECLTRLEHDVEEGHCPLCKSPIDNTKGKSQALRIRLELEFQVRESVSLREDNERLLEEKKAQLRRMKHQLTSTQRRYDDAVNYVRSTHEERIDKLLQDKGFKEGEILQYRTFLELAEKYEHLIEEQEELRAREAKLQRLIDAKEANIRQERRIIDAAVSESGVYLLRKDENRQDEFMKAQEFVIDYNQNMAYISNQRIKLSASSAFYLKMVARFAILFASLRVDSMMYPRLLFSDNMEDKGLTPDRAVQFQKTVVSMLSKVPQDDYQLIFATSMLAPELDKPEYTIGDFYSHDNKSLKNV